MRLISFSLTEPQVRARTKTVTRRLGWHGLKPGTLLRGVHKCMGLKPGEKPREIAVVRVLSVRREPLDTITDEDVEREGFPGQTAAWFVAHFTNAMRCDPSVDVARIEFDYPEPQP